MSPAWMSHCHIYEWVMARMRHVSYMNDASCHTDEWVMSHRRISHVTYTSESRHIHECVMSHSWTTRHVTQTNESCYTDEWVTSHTRLSHVTYTNASCLTHDWVKSHTHVCQYRAAKTRRMTGRTTGGGAPSCRSLFAKEPLITGLFCRKRPMKIGHPMVLCHPVYFFAFCGALCVMCIHACGMTHWWG